MNRQVLDMGRPRKKPEYNKDILQDDFMNMVADAYLHPAKGTQDEDGHMYLNLLAQEFGMTPIKIRKILVTAGVYETPTSLKVNELYESGKSVAEICKIMNLSVASVNGYLPYKKAIYKMKERTLLAERLVRYRRRKEAVDKLKYSMANEDEEQKKAQFKEALEAFAGYRFQTEQGVRFDYLLDSERVILSEEEAYSGDELFEMIDADRPVSDERIEVVLRRIL